MGEARDLITISENITDISLPRIAIYRIEHYQTIPTIIDNIGYPAYRFIYLGISYVQGIALHDFLTWVKHS